MSPIGIKVHLETTNPKAQHIISTVKKVVKRKGLDDSSWAEAISSQYFLLCLAKQLDIEKEQYYNLIDMCLEPLSVTHDSKLLLNDKKIQITPTETKRIVQAMKIEDKQDPYFNRTPRMKAQKINTQLMYRNFHYGLLVRNVSSLETDVLKKTQRMCLEELISNSAIDKADGWYPYRVPWISGRILISLRNIDFEQFEKKKRLDELIVNAIDSLYRRINEDASYWRSGVGNWVNRWESTALCLEALYVWDSITAHVSEVESIVRYACEENQLKEWLEVDVDFSDENKANNTLAAVTFASVIYRVTKKYYRDFFNKIENDVVSLFTKVISQIDKKDVSAVQQYCTLPQILYYLVAAFETVSSEVEK